MLVNGDWKVCKSARALYLSAIKNTCNKGANKSSLSVYVETDLQIFTQSPS
jgi:hypothetical protein